MKRNKWEELINNSKTKLITDFHVSGDKVYNIDDKYILKVSNNTKRLKHEKEFNDFLYGKLPVCKSIDFEIVDDKAFYLKEYVDGVNLCDDRFVNNPKRLVKILSNACKLLHLYKNENGESLIHGDLCLPNILVNDNDEIVAFIDLAYSTFSNDLWLDYAWVIWSFEYNLKSKKWTNILLKELNISFDEEKYNEVIKKSS